MSICTTPQALQQEKYCTPSTKENLLLRTCNHLLVRACDEKIFFKDICNSIVEIGGYRMAWIGKAVKDSTMRVIPVAHAGFEQDYLKKIYVTWNNTKYGKGPIGTCIRTGRPAIQNDIKSQTNFEPWREEALKRGYASSVCLPIHSAGNIHGALNIYSSESGAFSSDNLKLLQTLADDLGFGLSSLRDRLELEESRHILSLKSRIAEIFITGTPETMYQKILDVVLESFDSELGYFGYIRQSGDLLCPAISARKWERGVVTDKGIVFPKETWGGLCGRSLKKKRTFYQNNIPNFPKNPLYFNCAIVSPILFQEKLIGQFFLANKKDGYTPKDVDYLEKMAKDIAPILDSYLRDMRYDTERKKLEKQLQQSQKMESIGTLAGGIAHDFNNILFPLMGYAELMKYDLPKNSPLCSNVDEILKAACRAKELVSQILTFSRSDSEGLMPLKLQLILKECLKLLRSSIPSTIKIKHDIEPECSLVMADATKIHQVIMNLTTNAFHAMEKTGGTLTVSLKQKKLDLDHAGLLGIDPGDYAVIGFNDTGEGIKKENLDKIFEPYFTTKKKGKGTGLGLSVVHGIIKSFKGSINVHSEFGTGATFNIYLPIIKKHNQITTRKNVDEELIGGNEHILLVDDEYPVARMESKIMEKLGYRVTVRTGSMEALETFRATPDQFDLIITDLTMPNMTGIELSCKIKEIKPDMPVIMCTGFGDMLTRDKCRHLDLQGYILKPPVIRDIAGTIRNALSTKKNRINFAHPFF